MTLDREMTTLYSTSLRDFNVAPMAGMLPGPHTLQSFGLWRKRDNDERNEQQKEQQWRSEHTRTVSGSYNHASAVSLDVKAFPALQSSGHTTMSEHTLTQIEAQLEQLIHRYTSLREEHQRLKEREEEWAEERLRLQEKNELARARIESMLQRLKQMETEV